MRRAAWWLLLLFAFSVPWEYSLDLGEPWGNAARIAGVVALLMAIPAILQAGRVRRPGTFCWITLAAFLWCCCSYFWTVDPAATLGMIRAYFQVMMVVWLVWEFAETPADLGDLLRALLAGAWVLVLLTLAAYRSPEAIATGQFRFAAYGQDPNDVARFLDFGFPLAALLARCEQQWPVRLAALLYLPAGLAAVLLTASRGGFLAAVIALAGSVAILGQGHARRLAVAAFTLPPFLATLWFLIPRATIERLATIPEQVRSGDLNQRLNIWSAGWQAFVHAPVLGSGAGTFVTAAKLSSIDTAHDTVLSVLVCGGLCALFLATLLVALAVRAALQTRGALRRTLLTLLLVWAVTSLVATVEESRLTWLMFATIVLAGRLAKEQTGDLNARFSPRPFCRRFAETPRLVIQSQS